MFVDVSFITVNYNTCALVKDLIEFFSKVDLPFSHCLVVVDNASTDGSREMLEDIADDRVVYLQTDENLGYGRGMNRGLAAVESRYSCIMNTDLILNREALLELWQFFQNMPEAGVASPVILGANGRQQGFVFSPGLLPHYFHWLAKFLAKRWKLRVSRAVSPLPVPGVMGAFFMIRRSAFPTRLFDEDFFFYYEDSELAHWYWQQKIPCHVLPNVSIIHLGGQSTSASGAKLFIESRNLYLEKCYGKKHAWLIGLLDLLRIRSKVYKYRLLSLISSSASIRAKYDYYASQLGVMQDAR